MTNDPRDAEIARLRALVEQRTAERDVWSGEACREEQAAGNGPCGACRYCYPAQLAAAQADNAALRAQNDCLRFNVDSFFRVWREYCEKKDEVDALTTSLADLQASADAYIQQTDPILDRVEVLSDERSEARRNLAAAQADNAALRGALERLTRHEVFPGKIGGPLTLHRVDLAHDAGKIASCFICAALARIATPAPGAPLLDAVRGLVAAVERIPLASDCTWREQRAGHDWPEALDALDDALAAVRAVLSPPQDTAGRSRGGDG